MAASETGGTTSTCAPLRSKSLLSRAAADGDAERVSVQGSESNRLMIFSRGAPRDIRVMTSAAFGLHESSARPVIITA